MHPNLFFFPDDAIAANIDEEDPEEKEEKEEDENEEEEDEEEEEEGDTVRVIGEGGAWLCSLK